MSQQLEMKFSVIENAINKLIGIVSSLTIENQKLTRRVEQLSRGQNVSANPENTKTDGTDENFELDISQVQKILKQQTSSSNPQTLGRRIINN